MVLYWRESVALFFIGCSSVVVPAAAAPRSDGQLTLEVVDGETGQPLAARMHLTNSRGRAVALRLPKSAEFGGHFYIDGQLALPLRIGQYTFELDAGPEYRTQSGHFEIQRHADDSKRIEMKRSAYLAEEGWFGGDLDLARLTSDLPLIMRAEGLRIAPDRVPSRGRTMPVAPAGPFVEMVHASGGELLLFGRESQPGIQAVRPAMSSLAAVHDARIRNLRVVARVPYAWDMPVWLASGELDAVILINHHSLREGTLDNEDDGRPRDRSLFPGRAGNGRWSEKVYYHALNCGWRVPPAAGSGSGANDNPVGTNRVYVYCGDAFSPDAWWDGLEAGRVFVSNGPLLRPLVEGKPPGHVFHLDDSGSLQLEIGLNLATRVPVEYLQIIKNGEVEAEVRLAEWTKQKGRLPPLVFDDSGWFLVRAVTSDQRTYQFASSGPYYVEKAGQPRISRRSVRFFLDWIAAAEARIRQMASLKAADRDLLLAEQESARRFFEDLLSNANAD